MASLGFRRRSRGNSLSAVTPPIDSPSYDPTYATIATKMLYKSPLPSQDDLPIFILDSAALPDADEVHYGSLLPYVLARLPTEEQLIGGKGYEVVFFAGGEHTGNGQPKKARPPWSWFLQAYQVLSRAMRKRLQKLYLVHERRWIRVMLETFSTVISPKFRRKIIHCSTLSSLALYIPVENLLIPPSAYDRDRRLANDIHVPYATGKRAFGATNPLPTSVDGNPRLPRVLREASSFVLDGANVRTEGIFRINARAQTLDILREAYDRGQKFIIWKEGSSVLTFGHWQDGHGEISANEIAQLDGYGVHTAAGLIKLWYSKLREPVFHEAVYPVLENLFGGDAEIDGSAFFELISQTVEFSPLPKTSRLILTMHLFPFLTRVADHADENRMPASNLAMCFAPALLCGADPVHDAKISRILTKFIQFGIENWDLELAKGCDMGGMEFEKLLKTPASPQDREDPLEGSLAGPSHSDHYQQQGITLLDQDSESSEEMEKPPLPPRILTSGPVTAEPVLSPASSSAIQRKPVPAPRAPPRYSTIVDTSAQASQSLPTYAEHDPAPHGNGESPIDDALASLNLGGGGSNSAKPTIPNDGKT